MGQKYAAPGAQGLIYFDSVDSPAPNGLAGLIEITDEDWQECLATPGYTIQNGALVAPAPQTPAQQLATLQASLSAQIDATADEVYIAIGGPSPGRLAEYQQANTDAQAFKSAGYTGTVPPTVQCWATASGMTSQAAADNIISTAAAWVNVLEGIREARLVGKANVTKATTTADAQSAANTAISQIQAMKAQA